ncbi:MAG: nucleotidyltransferase domain-containing protein [Nitrospiraceae bacterium]|nr:nucleotidyltransferase domain-containing protein [Nitrospiraceae bacterium]
MTTAKPQNDYRILKVLVGSQAHGLAGPESDADYRSVFVIPTADLFRVGFKYQGTKMVKQEEDETAWEIGLFLTLATECYPLVLETLVAPVAAADDWGGELRTLFPALWSPEQAFQAFAGYCENQRKKMLDRKDGRPEKYAAAYIRVLFNLCELLERETFAIRVSETPIGETVATIKSGKYRTGEVIDLGESLLERAKHNLPLCRHRPNPELVDRFLYRIRKAFLV